MRWRADRAARLISIRAVGFGSLKLQIKIVARCLPRCPADAERNSRGILKDQTPDLRPLIGNYSHHVIPESVSLPEWAHEKCSDFMDNAHNFSRMFCRRSITARPAYQERTMDQKSSAEIVNESGSFTFKITTDNTGAGQASKSQFCGGKGVELWGDIETPLGDTRFTPER